MEGVEISFLTVNVVLLLDFYILFTTIKVSWYFLQMQINFWDIWNWNFVNIWKVTYNSYSLL